MDYQDYKIAEETTTAQTSMQQMYIQACFQKKNVLKHGGERKVT